MRYEDPCVSAPVNVGITGTSRRHGVSVTTQRSAATPGEPEGSRLGLRNVTHELVVGEGRARRVRGHGQVKPIWRNSSDCPNECRSSVRIV
ncbi:hypothetical protein RRG08_045284 [Elysia crispata]|uniref:Uncharacterized protein n=1 Tax=Elysia crispata TaxID=231223 RepID=A0AAE1A281_9GAST|nr:hypothetical protein RRG08_045284 [Elysia crispata]